MAKKRNGPYLIALNEVNQACPRFIWNLGQRYSSGDFRELYAQGSASSRGQSTAGGIAQGKRQGNTFSLGESTPPQKGEQDFLGLDQHSWKIQLEGSFEGEAQLCNSIWLSEVVANFAPQVRQLRPKEKEHATKATDELPVSHPIKKYRGLQVEEEEEAGGENSRKC